MSGSTGPAQPAATKSKRTRTGCLTCRRRHLKCDEALPLCQNCVKSKKQCERGIRLNFLETTVEAKAPMLRPGPDWHVQFMDESIDIASEYEGGSALYGPLLAKQSLSNGDPARRSSLLGSHYIQPPNHFRSQQPPPPPVPQSLELPMQPTAAHHPPSANPAHHSNISPHGPSQNHAALNGRMPAVVHPNDSYMKSTPPSAVESPSHFLTPTSHLQQSVAIDSAQSDLDDKRELLKDAQEVLYMQVFCEEVGIWMDSMDSMKHFSRLLPFHSLAEPMLRNAFLACGARHLTLVNPIYSGERALLHYDTATRHLLKNLQDPDRDTVVCATTAVILNVYEIMCERALPRMNHIAGARALIKECGWDARAVGVGAACFWLNVGLEVLSCLHFKWQAAWGPDDWGLDLDWSREVNNGREEVWTHRMLYIVAKVSNFRATVPKKPLPDPAEERVRQENRYKEWQALNELADNWNQRIPRTMHPMAYIFPEQTSSKSAFPEVWLIKRATIVARLFYHTVMVLLAQTNPIQSRSDPEMWNLERTHSSMICGISAHVKDRGVASVALRSLAHAAECLTDRAEQQEVLDIFTKINRETGWRIAFVFKELKAMWDWKDNPSVPTPHITSNSDPTPRPVGSDRKLSALSFPPGYTNNNESLSPHSAHSSQASHSNSVHVHQPAALGRMSTSPTNASPTTAARPQMPSGIKNPLFANADFSMPQHPYQNVYVAPNSSSAPQQPILQGYLPPPHPQYGPSSLYYQ